MGKAKPHPRDPFDVSAYPPLPRAPGFFVTATDTEVGKTLVAGSIARHLRAAGRRLSVFKPAATGCVHEGLGRGLVSQDGAFLAECADTPQPHEDVVPLRFRHALSPNVAAQREHRPVDLEAMFAAYRRAATAGDCIVVEGVGGLLCPISDDFSVIHLARLAGLPLVIVARAGLGTINHTLLTLHAARSAGLDVAGVVVNRYQIDPAAAKSIEEGRPSARGDADLAMYTNPQQIADRGGVEVLALVPDDPRSSVERSAIGPDVQYAIDQVPWLRMLERRRP